MIKIISILVLLYSLHTTYQLDPSRNYAHLTNISPPVNENSEQVSKTLVDINRNSLLSVDKKLQEPCSRGNLQSNPIDNPDEWLPTYSTRVVKPTNSGNSGNNKINSQFLKNDKKLIKTVSKPEDTLLAQKYPEQKIGVFFNPHNNFNPSRNLLVSNEDKFEGHDEQVQLRDDSQLNIGMEEDTLTDTTPEKENQYRKSNTNLLGSEKSEQPNVITLSKPPVERSQQDRDVLVDDDYLSKAKADIETESELFLPSNTKLANPNSVKDEPINKADNYIQREDEQDSDNCLTIEQELQKHIKEHGPRRFLSDGINLEENRNNLSNDGFERNDDQQENVFLDPAKGVGIREMSVSKMSLLQHSRVCYACSTVNNPTCWVPDRRTTVKYCRQGHQACVTKTFQNSQDKLIVTRDCGESCDDTDIPGPKYKSCSVCHTDMCNDTPSGASSIKNENFILGIFILFVIKCPL